MRSILGVSFFCLAFILLMLELSVLAGTDTLPMADTAVPAGLVHAVLLLGAAMIGWSALWLLRGSLLWRLVRGRGFTPEPVRP